MRADVEAPTHTGARHRATTLTVWPITETPREVLLGTATGGLNWSQYATRVSVTHTGASISLQLPDSVDAPVPDQLVTIADTDDTQPATVFSGVIESVDQVDGLGVRSTSLVVRRRDASPLWRDVQRVSEPFAAGTDLGTMAARIAETQIESDEHDIGRYGAQVVRHPQQFVQIPLWDMLRACLLPVQREPTVDELGRLTTISRDVRRPSALTIPEASILEIGSATSRPALTTCRVKWVSPDLVEVLQSDQRLAGPVTATVGFFGGTHQYLRWSDDGTRQAQDVTLRIIQNANASGSTLGVGDVADFQYLEIDGDGYGIGDGVEYGPNIPITGSAFARRSTGGWLHVSTIQMESALAAGLLASVGQFTAGITFGMAFGTLMAIGVGVYEVWGRPIDYVEAVNVFEARAADAPAWRQSIEDIESALIPDEDVARAVATGELLYRTKAAKRARLALIDDYRIQVGDILDLPGSRRPFYVTGYSRDMSHGSLARIDLEGFHT